MQGISRRNLLSVFGLAAPNQTIAGTTTTKTGDAGNAASIAETRASAVATRYPNVASGGPTFIRTTGYASVNDGGGATYVRVGSAPSYSSLVWFQSADGQYWGMVRRNEPLKLEQAGGGVNATGAANNAAVEAINSMFTNNSFGSGYGFAGANFQLGYGIYNFASPWFVKGGCKIQGMGSAFYGGFSTTLKFPAGSDGLVLGAGGSNGRLYNPSIYGTFDGRASVIRDLYIVGGWTGGTTYATNHTTGMRGIGILSKAPATIENVYVTKFAEFGIFIKGTAGGGGSSTEPAFGTSDNTDPSESYVCAHGYANSFALFRVACEENGLDGFRFRGADCNAGSIISCSATLNVGWGFNDLCFLGNWYWGNHAASNGTTDGHDANSGKQFGAYQCYGDSQYTAFVANYSEGDYPGRNSYITGFSILIGGLLAGGFHNSPWNIGALGNLTGSTIRIPPAYGTEDAKGTEISPGDQNNVLQLWKSNNDGLWWKTQSGHFSAEVGFAAPPCLEMTRNDTGAQFGRSAAVGRSHIKFPRGFFIGADNVGNTDITGRMHFASPGLPTSGTFAQGDVCYITNASPGGVWGYQCTSGGTYGGTSPVWKAMGTLAS